MNNYIIIAGLGRCGTKFMWFSICNHIKQDITKNGFVKKLSGYNFKKGMVYKTHDIALDVLCGNPKVIFMFGNPMNCIVSTQIKTDEITSDWWNLHCYNFGIDPLKKELFHKEDILNLEILFDSWYKFQSFPLLTLRYETMYENLDKIMEFLELPNLIFPKKQQRNTDWTQHPLKDDIENTYKSLNNKILKAEDCKIW